MATLREISEHLNWNIPNKYNYSARLYYDPASDNSNVYVKIDDIPCEFQFAFDFVSKGECRSKFVKYQGQFVNGISAELFIPVKGHTNDWQINFYLDDGSMDRIHFTRSNWNSKGLQGTTENLEFSKLVGKRWHSQEDLGI